MLIFPYFFCKVLRNVQATSSQPSVESHSKMFFIHVLNHVVFNEIRCDNQNAFTGMYGALSERLLVWLKFHENIWEKHQNVLGEGELSTVHCVGN